MARKYDPSLDKIVPQVCGLIVGVFLTIPPLIRLANGRWAGDNLVVVLRAHAVWALTFSFSTMLQL
ncbi:hypothetical protein [Arthrobacter sp. MDT1-65]